MGPREGKTGASLWLWPRMFALVGLLGLIVIDAIHGDGKMGSYALGGLILWLGLGLG